MYEINNLAKGGVQAQEDENTGVAQRRRRGLEGRNSERPHYYSVPSATTFKLAITLLLCRATSNGRAVYFTTTIA